MIRMKVLIAFCFILFTSLLLAQGWQQIQGPFGGTFRDIQRYKDGSLFLSVDGGIYKSTDNAATWNKIDFGFNEQLSGVKLFIHPTGIIFIPTGWGGLYCSDRTGNNWHNVGYSVSSLNGIDKKGNLYATYGNGYLGVSRDLGYSWQDLKKFDYWINSFLEVDSTHFIVTNKQSVSLTSDAGATWNDIKIPTADEKWIWNLEMDSKKNIYAKTENELFSSKDLGKTWSKINFPAPYSYTLNINSKDEIFISTQFDLYSSKDYGITWSVTNFNDILLFVNEDSNGDLYSGSFTKLYKKEASSLIWRELETKLNNRRISYVLAYKNDMYVGSIDKLYRSTDNGDTWQEPYKSEWAMGRLYQIDSKGRIYSSVDAPLSYSTDKGNSWTSIPVSFPNDDIPYIAVSSDDIIYASTNRGELFYTKDFGKTWVRIFKELSPNPSACKITLTKNNELYFASVDDLYKYSRATNTYELIGHFDKGIGQICVSPLGIVYVYANGAIYFMYGNHQWTKTVISQFDYVQQMNFTDNNELVIINRATLYISRDLGRTFLKIDKPTYAATPISFFLDNDGNYFLGTQENGLFKTNIGSSKALLPTQTSLSQNYPNPFNGQTSIQFILSYAQNVSLKVYDILGRELETIVDSFLPLGYYKFDWHPNAHASGIYIYQLRAESFIDTRKMVFMK